jgi:hypothetical protein
MTENQKHYDIIGDVHGHAEALEALLKELGYREQEGCYRHPQRLALFLGDLIDRGTESFRTLEMIKAMVDEGSALIVMGNHEYNALCYHTRDSRGNFLRPHSRKNRAQHQEVLTEIEKRGEEWWEMILEWFRRLPLFLELEGLRIVHACWDRRSIDFMKNNPGRDSRGRLTDEFLIRSSQKGSDAFNAVEALLQGLEIMLPPGHPGVYDKENLLRRALRLKWWIDCHERENWQTYEQAVRVDEDSLARIAGLEIPGELLKEIKNIEEKENSPGPPVFFGHYWFNGEPRPLTETAACLDYSVARGGKLVCYRWDGEQTLNPAKFTWLKKSGW